MLAKNRMNKHGLISQSRITPLYHVMHEIRAISSQLDALEALGISGTDMLCNKAQLKLIEAQLSMDLFLIGSCTCNTKADIALFVEKEMAGLFFLFFMILSCLWKLIS